MLLFWIVCIWGVVYEVACALSAPLSEVPGPWYTKVTSLWIKFQEFRGNRRLAVHRLHQKYGPVVRLAPNEVSFTGLDAVREIYTSGGSGYDKTEFYDLFRQYGIKTLFSILSRAPHSQRKRVFGERYTMTNVMRQEITDAIYERATRFVSNCNAAKDKSADIYIQLHCYALDCVTHFMFGDGGLDSFGKDFGFMEELTFHHSLQKNLLQYYLPTIGPFLPAFLVPRPTPKSKQYVVDMAHRSNPNPSLSSSNRTLLEKLRDPASDLSTMQAAAECSDHMAAGIDTTGDGLCFLMHTLSLPECAGIQRRLRAELVEAGPVTGRELDELAYLDGVVKEGLRCAPPIPMSLPRYVPKGGRMIDGYFVPEKVIVSCQAYSVHRLNEAVFPDGERFFPDRWLVEKGSRERDKLFFAFAMGSRGCTGKNLALVEMKTLLREVYSRFETRIAPDMTGSMEIDDQIISSRPRDQTCKLMFIPLEASG